MRIVVFFVHIFAIITTLSVSICHAQTRRELFDRIIDTERSLRQEQDWLRADMQTERQERQELSALLNATVRSLQGTSLMMGAGATTEKEAEPAGDVAQPGALADADLVQFKSEITRLRRGLKDEKVVRIEYEGTLLARLDGIHTAIERMTSGQVRPATIEVINQNVIQMRQETEQKLVQNQQETEQKLVQNQQETEQKLVQNQQETEQGIDRFMQKTAKQMENVMQELEAIKQDVGQMRIEASEREGTLTNALNTIKQDHDYLLGGQSYIRLTELVDGVSTPGKFGRVEVLHNGVWGTVCNDAFGHEEAVVTCRNLGYEGGSVGRRYGAEWGEPPSDRFWLDNVQCSGQETSLFHCGHRGWGTHNCDQHFEEVGVICQSVSNF